MGKLSLIGVIPAQCGPWISLYYISLKPISATRIMLAMACVRDLSHRAVYPGRLESFSEGRAAWIYYSRNISNRVA